MNRQHAIIEKKIINLDHAGDRHVMCAWDDCENDGVELHKVVINYGKANTPKLVNHVFCSERHKQFFINSAKEIDGVPQYGRLPPGYRRSFI
jgi:hypothetical protein